MSAIALAWPHTTEAEARAAATAALGSLSYPDFQARVWEEYEGRWHFELFRLGSDVETDEHHRRRLSIRYCEKGYSGDVAYGVACTQPRYSGWRRERIYFAAPDQAVQECLRFLHDEAVGLFAFISDFYPRCGPELGPIALPEID